MLHSKFQLKQLIVQILSLLPINQFQFIELLFIFNSILLLQFPYSFLFTFLVLHVVGLILGYFGFDHLLSLN